LSWIDLTGGEITICEDLIPAVMAIAKKSRSVQKIKGGRYYLSYAISKFNIKRIDDLLLELRKEIPDFALADIHFNFFHRSSHYCGNEEAEGVDGLDAFLVEKHLSLSKKGNPVKIFLENEYIKGVSRFLSAGRTSLRCQALNATCFMDPYGKIYPCGIYDKPLGDLAHYGHDVRTLWNAESSLAALEEIRGGRCPGCWSPCEAYPAILGCAIRNLIFP